MHKAPVLFIVFNRAEKTRKVLEQIAIYQPERLYVAADGPRHNVPADIVKCQQVRNNIMELITWPCELKTSFSIENKGCRKSVSEAINWFFAHEPFGIILEDDCVPSQSFFRYATEMLVYYENDESIISISGSNLGYHSNARNRYFASRYLNMWGWATWRRVAQKIDYDLTEWKSKNNFSKLLFLLMKIGYSYSDRDWGWILFWRNIFNKVSNNEIDTWDYQWFYFQFKFDGITIFPAANLVTNIGFDLEATHTISNESINQIPLKELTFPLTHPDTLKPETEFEEKYIKRKWAYYNRLSTYWHIKQTVHRIFFKKK